MLKQVELKCKKYSSNGIPQSTSSVIRTRLLDELAAKPSWYWNHDLRDKSQLNVSCLKVELVLGNAEVLSLTFCYLIDLEYSLI